MRFKIKNPIAFWYKLAQSFAAVGMFFWLLETAYFLILEGWHWKATNPAEIWADYVVQFIFGGVFVAMGLCLIELIEDRVRLDRHWEEFSGKMEGALKGLSDDDLKPAFECHGCGHVLPDKFSLRTEGFCYLCDPNITVDELLSDATIAPKSKTE